MGGSFVGEDDAAPVALAAQHARRTRTALKLFPLIAFAALLISTVLQCRDLYPFVEYTSTGKCSPCSCDKDMTLKSCPEYLNALGKIDLGSKNISRVKPGAFKGLHGVKSVWLQATLTLDPSSNLNPLHDLSCSIPFPRATPSRCSKEAHSRGLTRWLSSGHM